MTCFSSLWQCCWPSTQRTSGPPADDTHTIAAAYQGSSSYNPPNNLPTLIQSEEAPQRLPCAQPLSQALATTSCAAQQSGEPIQRHPATETASAPALASASVSNAVAAQVSTPVAASISTPVAAAAAGSASTPAAASISTPAAASVPTLAAAPLSIIPSAPLYFAELSSIASHPEACDTHRPSQPTLQQGSTAVAPASNPSSPPSADQHTTVPDTSHSTLSPVESQAYGCVASTVLEEKDEAGVEVEEEEEETGVDIAAPWQGLGVEQTGGSGRLHRLPPGKENDAEVAVAVLTPAWGKNPKGIDSSLLTPTAQGADFLNPSSLAAGFLLDGESGWGSVTPAIVGVANPTERFQEDRRVSRHLTPFAVRVEKEMELERNTKHMLSDLHASHRRDSLADRGSPNAQKHHSRF